MGYGIHDCTTVMLLHELFDMIPVYAYKLPHKLALISAHDHTKDQGFTWLDLKFNNIWLPHRYKFYWMLCAMPMPINCRNQLEKKERMERNITTDHITGKEN